MKSRELAAKKAGMENKTSWGVLPGGIFHARKYAYETNDPTLEKGLEVLRGRIAAGTK